MKQRCLSLVLAISMIMASASPFSYAKDTRVGVLRDTRTTTTDETEEILPIKATDSEASDIREYPLDNKERIASASDCTCQEKVDTKKGKITGSPVRSCTELGFCSPRQQPDGDD